MNLKTKKDTLEEDNDRLEKAKSCLQGHVKNEFIKATCYKDLLTNTTEILNVQMKTFLVCNLISIFYMIVPFMNFTINYSLVMILTIVSIHSSIIINTYNKINTLKTDDKIQKTEQEILPSHISRTIFLFLCTTSLSVSVIYSISDILSPQAFRLSAQN